MLEVKDLRVSYGSIEALHGISFHVEEGEIVTLIGANGAGKSTTLMTISRQIPYVAELGGRVTGGTILYHGDDLLNKVPPTMSTQSSRRQALRQYSAHLRAHPSTSHGCDPNFVISSSFQLHLPPLPYC